MINLNDSILNAANDNGSIPACETGCGRPAASKDHMLCAVCTADMNAHIDAGEFFYDYDANDMGAADYSPGKF